MAKDLIKMVDIIDKKNRELIDNISDQIRIINQFIDWSEKNLAESRKIEVFKKLVNERRKLKRYLFSLSSNPAIAAFGESQKGKSYVISSLLASKGKQFSITDKNGTVFNFIEELNPPTNDTEATGVVTRFTRDYEILDEDYPILVKLLSISDILQILCNTAYLDIKDHTVLKSEDINEYVELLLKRYSGMPEIQRNLDEDDIFNIREHIQRYMSNVASELLNSDFFDVLAQIITRVQPKDWPSIMSKLWYDNIEITELFKRILEGYQTLEYARYVYIPISALLNSHTTLMSSMCLQRLGECQEIVGNKDLNFGTDLLYSRHGENHIISGFNKSILSAITAEVIFKIPESSIEEQLKFHFEGINDEATKNHLLSKGWHQTVTKDFLKNIDILDFPGARSRLELEESQIPKELAMQMVLRGKVSYLFNKYSDEKLINVLMICHDHMQNGSSAMPPILKKWIEDNIGKDAKDRTAFIDKSIISPLFLIATKFNVDLRVDVSETKNELIDNRWDERFNKVLYNQVLMATSNNWFENWTLNGNFKNTFLLRDYKYSGERGNRIFSGYIENGKETSENDIEFRRKLKRSFLENDNAKKFFEDSELAWDSACTLNNDGSVLIIQKLSIVAENAKESRYYKNLKDIKSIHDDIVSLMKEYFHEENDDNALQKAIGKCGAIIAELDIICGRNNYFFGRMINSLQISENYVFDIFYRAINTTQMISERDLKEYDLIISRCKGLLSVSNTFEENLEILRQFYHFSSLEECRNFFENVKHISLEKLFKCDFKQKTNSIQFAESVLNNWLEDLRAPKKLKYFESLGCNSLIMLDLIENLKCVSESIGLASIIATKISPFVDAISVPHAILDMIADTTAEMINDFILSFGYNYYGSEKISELKRINEKNNLHLSFKYQTEDRLPLSVDELSQLFDDIRPTEENSKLTMLPSYVSYNKWIDLLLISFIASYDIPNYDIEANKRLGQLLTDYCVLSC